MENFKILIYNAIKSYGAVLLLNNKYLGFALLLITFLNPSVAISGLFAVVFTIAFAEFIEIKESYLLQSFYIYNSLLVGMGIGFIYSPSLTSFILIAISSAFTFMFAFMLNRLFSVYKIPVLSLPFSIVTMLIYLASIKYSGMLSTLAHNTTHFDIALPLIVSAFFKAFGSIFFLPTTLAGLLMVLLILYFSRIVIMMALVGFYFGIFVHSFFIGSFAQALYDPYAFNYILVAIALCGVFLLPTIKNFVLALVGVAISVMLTDAIATLFASYYIPIFTLPFNITVMTFIFILSSIYYKEFNLEIKATPEASLSNYLSKIFRFGKSHIKISLPFSGEWSIYQAFSDAWTHKGKYRHAYDFVKKFEGRNYKNKGLFKEDYYAFGESVLAPVNGYVIDLRHDLQDNAIGEVDRLNNWGNYIIIKSDLGFFVEISHLMQYSINVHVGEYVKINTPLAKCGNSGYSPEPHIHIQVQELGLLGGFTEAFSFSEYLQDKELVLNALPPKDAFVSSVINDKSISSRFLFILDDTFAYEVFENGIKTSEFNLKIQMNELGEFYFIDHKENKLYFYNDLKQFYFYNYEGEDSHLKWFFILAPRLPFLSSQKVHFKDFLPIYLQKSKLETLFIELASTIKKDFYKSESTYSFDGVNIISQYGSICLEPHTKGYANLKYKNIELRIIK